MTRYIRNIKRIVKSPYISQFIEEEEEITYDVLDSLNTLDKIDNETIENIRSQTGVQQRLNRVMDITNEKAKVTDTKNAPNQNLSKAINNLKSIDTNIIHYLDENQKADILENINQIEEIISKLRETLNV